MASAKFEKVKAYFEQGLWPKSWVKNAVGKGWITKDEYEEIVGEPLETEAATEK